MKNRLVLSFGLAVGLLMICVPLLAHHGNAAYDYTATKTVKGTVTDWTWANPHCFLWLDSKDENGNTTHWVLEASSPVDMRRTGWAATTLKSGDEVTVEIMPAKNGATVGRIRRVVLPDGKVLISAGRFTL
jgi:hypothetical protein